jgi:hypothetical protein
LNRRYRTEDLFPQHRGAVGHVGQHSGREKEPLAVQRLAADQNLGALLNSVLDQFDHLLARFRVDQRSKRDAVLETMADLEGAHALGKLGGEGVMDIGMDIEPVCRRAGLSHVSHFGDHGALDRRVDIGVVKDDEGRVAPKLHNRPHDVVRGGVEKFPSHLGRAGEGEDADAKILEHRADHCARTT